MVSNESKQNISNTTGNTKGGSIGFAPNGMPSLSANYSQTNGERKYVDTPTTFLIGEGSNLKVGKVGNTAAAIGTTGDGKLSIDEYVEHNLENVDKLKTAGGSIGVSTSGVNNIGVNYPDKKQEGITKNTVVGNVIENIVNPKGEDKRNIFANLRAQRWSTSFYNITGSRMEELSRQFKTGEIDKKIEKY